MTKVFVNKKYTFSMQNDLSSLCDWKDLQDYLSKNHNGRYDDTGKIIKLLLHILIDTYHSEQIATSEITGKHMVNHQRSMVPHENDSLTGVQT